MIDAVDDRAEVVQREVLRRDMMIFHNRSVLGLFVVVVNPL